jgi:hypothetical protein
MHHFGTADGYEKEGGARIDTSALPAVLRHSEKNETEAYGCHLSAMRRHGGGELSDGLLSYEMPDKPLWRLLAMSLNERQVNG